MKNVRFRTVHNAVRCAAPWGRLGTFARKFGEILDTHSKPWAVLGRGGGTCVNAPL